MIESSCHYVCSMCKGMFEFEKVKYTSDGNTIMCIDCLKRFDKPEDHKMDMSGKKNIETRPKSDSLKVVCVTCKYKFVLRRKPDIVPKCPYCGNGKLMKDETTAERLIDEVNRVHEQAQRR